MSNECRLIDRYELQGDLVEALENTEHHRHLAEKVKNCHKKFRRKCCDRNHDWASADNSCSVRICPHCSHRRSKILAARLQAFLVGKTGLRYLVLAETNSENCEAGIASLWKAWTSLRRSVCWKRKVKGCVAVLEVTFNERDKTYHPHLNVLTEGEYFPFEELNKAWIKATAGNGQTSFIQAADENTVHELIKYVTKIADLLAHPAALDEFLSAVYGCRIVRTYGSFRSMKTEDEENPGEECPDCGSTCIVDLGWYPLSQLCFDFEKQVFRVRGSPPARALRDVMDFAPWKFAMDGYRRPDSVGNAIDCRRRSKQYEKEVCKTFRTESLRQPAA